jgi:hypothetical protein
MEHANTLGGDESSTMTAMRAVALPSDPLAHLTRAERELHLRRYLEFLRARDGVPDRARRRLSNRDPFFDEIDREPVVWKGDIGKATFHAYLEKKPPDETERRLVWLLAAAKVNRSERYGIDRELDRADKVGSDGDPWLEFIGLEEVYHSRLLADACRACGLVNPKIDPPPAHRTFIHLTTSLPESLRTPFVMAGEIFGCVAFQVMYENVFLFDEQPEVAARLRRLTQEILIDEMGHVAYCRSLLGRFGLFVTRSLLPIIGYVLLHDMPELALLAGGSRPFMERARNFDFANFGRSARSVQSAAMGPIWHGGK